MEKELKSNDDVPTIQVVEYDAENEYFSLDVEGLKQFLLDPSIADLKVAVISVAGAFRMGKSFFLNFFVRYLHHVEKHGFGENKMLELDATKDGDDYYDDKSMKSEDEEQYYKESLPKWLREDDEDDKIDRFIKGFKWRGGSQRETHGIVMYKKPFIVKTEEHGNIVLLLMDTQGTFDWMSTVKSCATVFALSTMLSSVQLFNLKHNVQEDDLNHLQFFTEYGRLVLEQSPFKPFQKLAFLVRDWSYSYEFEYGPNSTYLAKILELHDNQPKELQAVRKHIVECFESIECVLLPYPGEAVASKKRFKGLIDDISPKFLKHTSDLVQYLVHPSKLTPKCVEGKFFTCTDLFYYFQTYLKIFQSDQLPEPKNILEATAEAGHLIALKDAQQFYIHQMNKFCGGEQPFVAKEALRATHQSTLKDAIDIFDKTKKMGSMECREKFLAILHETIDERYKEFCEANEGKNLLKTFRFIIIVFVAFVALMIVSETLELIGMAFCNTPFVFAGRLCIILMVMWVYLRSSGNMREGFILMNQIADCVWDLGLQTIYENFSPLGTTAPPTNDHSFKNNKIE